MKRPRPHVPGATNAAVDQDRKTETEGSVPKSLRTRRGLAAARARAARDDRMRYIRTDTDGSVPAKFGDSSDGGGR